MKTSEELKRELVLVKDETQKRDALRKAVHGQRHHFEKLHRHYTASKIVTTYFEDLKRCWKRIRQLQLSEFTRLGLDTSTLVSSSSTNKLTKGPTEVSTAGCSKPTTHPSAKMSKELAPEKSHKLFRRSSRKRLRDGKRYGKVCLKVEHEAQNLPDAQSNRR
jgi:hypothetical protein